MAELKIGDTVRVNVGFSWPGQYKIVKLTKLGRVPAAVVDTGEFYTRTFPLTDLVLVVAPGAVA